jgi:hypothetical protein
MIDFSYTQMQMCMNKEPLLLRVLRFSHREMEALVRCAVKVMHVDHILRLEEESIINLIPSLLRVAKDDAPEELKSEWRKRLIAASYAIKISPVHSREEIEALCHTISDYAKRATCLVVLFLITGSDNHIDRREIDFILRDIAAPWNYSVQELIDLLKEESEKVFIPGKLICYLENLL